MRISSILWMIPLLIMVGFCTMLTIALQDEMRTSALQADWLTWYDQRMTYHLEKGFNPSLRFPRSGPYNQRLGYSYLPVFFKGLESENFVISEQMRTSPTFNYFLERGIYPIYHPKAVAGLTLFDRRGEKLYSAGYPTHVFTDFQNIPPLVVHTLLYIENRELLKDGPVTRNPVIEWDRFGYAVLGQIIRHFAPGFNAGGGSTLATQIEKFRFSPGGQTTSGLEKLRQIASASLRVYLDGADTRKAREQIVLDYLNSTPLSARPGFGEVNSLGDGLWAWFGIDLSDACQALTLPETEPDYLKVKARVYRAVLGLILAQRRPSYYLVSDHTALDDLTDATLDRLAEAKVISPELRTATKQATLHFLSDPPIAPQLPYIEQKAPNALRNHLLTMLGLKNLYEIDHLDLTAHSSLDQAAQQQTVNFLKNLGSPDFLKSIGLYGFRLLSEENDPKKIKWSVVLFERTDEGNKLRIQADNIDEPFDMNEGVKLDLGSTAKLRTLVTYLEIVSELYRRYAGLSEEDLQDLSDEAPDNLTQWATTWLTSNPKATLEDMLRAALDRKYSASPAEAFFTGGGRHIFANFEARENSQIMNLHEAFRESVNLVFIRLMRDIVNYTIAQGPQTKQELLDDPDEPARQSYLQRFADQEGSVFLNRYINDYIDLSPSAAMDKLLARAHKGATARTIIFRSLAPQGSFKDYVEFMTQHPLKETVPPSRLAKLYQDYPIDRYNLSDRGYIAGLNPLELWLAGYLAAHPHAPRHTILEVSRPIRIDSYAWLFNPRLKRAQDTRIRIMIEEDAFARIQKRWARLGYPFDKLTPSLATAIGAAGDRPGALADLVGIILNDGLKKKTIRFESMLFAEGTPYQTLLVHDSSAPNQQLLEPTIAKVMRDIMTEVVENGTAKRVKGVYRDASGKLLPVGGKTGTGDHRYDEFGPGGKLISSRVISRTGTFVFYIGDHFFGTITAHVAGEDAADYTFTSALSAQVLKSLAPIFEPLLTGGQPIAILPPSKPEPTNTAEPDEGEGEGDDMEEQTPSDKEEVNQPPAKEHAPVKH